MYFMFTIVHIWPCLCWNKIDWLIDFEISLAELNLLWNPAIVSCIFIRSNYRSSEYTNSLGRTGQHSKFLILTTIIYLKCTIGILRLSHHIPSIPSHHIPYQPMSSHPIRSYYCKHFFVNLLLILFHIQTTYTNSEIEDYYWLHIL